MGSFEEVHTAIKELKAQAEEIGKFNPENWSFEDPFCAKVHEVLIDASVELVGLQETIDALELKIKHIEEGFEGCCQTCEPVGTLNIKLQEERDKARRMAAHQYANKYAPDDEEHYDKLYKDYFAFHKWDYSEEHR